MPSIFNDAFGDRLARVAALRPARGRAARSPGVDCADSVHVRSDDGELARLLGGTVTRNRYGEHLLIRQWYPTPEPCLAENDSRVERVLRLLLPKAGKSKRDHTLAHDPNQWLFLDTETTGLAGGSGMYAFLVGVAWWESGGLQVEQFFMRDYDEEHALLETLRERMRERRVLVTFNGKTFDWPLLDTRYRMTRGIRTRHSRRASRFSAPGAAVVAAEADFCSACRARAPRFARLTRLAARLDARRRCGFLPHPDAVFQLRARGCRRAAGAGVPSQSNGPARLGGDRGPGRGNVSRLRASKDLARKNPPETPWISTVWLACSNAAANRL